LGYLLGFVNRVRIDRIDQQAEGQEMDRVTLLNAMYHLLNERVHLAKTDFDPVSQFYELFHRLKLDKAIGIEMIAWLHTQPYDLELMNELLTNNEVVRAGNVLVYNGQDPTQHRASLVRVLALSIRHFYAGLTEVRLQEQLRLNFSHKTITRIVEAV
jgi:hypothetical protein